MVVNGLSLPDSFAQLLAAIEDGRSPDWWEAKAGSLWVGGICLEIHASIDLIQWHTDMIVQLYQEEGRFQGGEISDITRIVCFGSTPSGEPFCFDFAEDPQEPSVIYWDDGDWQRVDPNFETFISQFEPMEP